MMRLKDVRSWQIGLKLNFARILKNKMRAVGVPNRMLLQMVLYVIGQELGIYIIRRKNE